MTRLWLILAIVTSAVYSVIRPQLPNLNILKHTRAQIDVFIDKCRSKKENHEFVGSSRVYEDNPPVPDGFVANFKSVRIGKGRVYFEKAADLMLKFAMVYHTGWAEIHLRGGQLEPRVGEVLCTLVKCFNLVWVLNPCRVVFVEKDINARDVTTRKSVRISQIGFSALDGHLIAGEERFRVKMDDKDDVYFDMYSFTRAGNALGQVVMMPVIRPLQRWFFADLATSMTKLIQQ